MSKHTPGPWQWFATEDGRARVNPVSGGLVIAECSTRNPFDAEQSANARLIATSPELYEAAMQVVEHMEWSTPQAKAAYDALCAALAKARGES